MIILKILIFSQKSLQEPWKFSKYDSIFLKTYLGSFCLFTTHTQHEKNIELQIACPLIRRISRILTKSVIFEFDNFCIFLYGSPDINNDIF